MIDGQLVGRATFDVPHWLPLGWHRLVATVEGGHVESATLIIVPNSLSLPLLESSRRVWGVNAQSIRRAQLAPGESAMRPTC